MASKTLWALPYTVGNDWLKLQINVFGVFGVWTITVGPLRTSAEVKARLVHLFQISYFMAVLPKKFNNWNFNIRFDIQSP